MLDAITLRAQLDAAELALRETEHNLDRLTEAHIRLQLANEDCERHNAELIVENARLARENDGMRALVSGTGGADA